MIIRGRRELKAVCSSALFENTVGLFEWKAPILDFERLGKINISGRGSRFLFRTVFSYIFENFYNLDKHLFIMGEGQVWWSGTHLKKELPHFFTGSCSRTFGSVDQITGYRVRKKCPLYSANGWSYRYETKGKEFSRGKVKYSSKIWFQLTHKPSKNQKKIQILKSQSGRGRVATAHIPSFYCCN